MICKGCGKELSVEQKFCSSCGLKNDVTQGQAPQGQAPQGQRPPYPMPQGQVPPYPMPQSQVPPYPMPQSQRPPYPMPQGQVPPYPIPQGQRPPYPMPQGQMPYNRIPPNPPIPPYPLPPNQSYTTKKNDPVIIVIIIISVLAFLIIGLFITINIIIISSVRSSIERTRDIVYDEYNNDSSTQYNEDNNDLFSEDGSNSDDLYDSYEYLYSYAELSDVISIDSDTRFAYYNYSSYEGVATYVYQFDSLSWTEADFYTALDEYSTTVANYNGFYYEEEFSNNQYDATGEVTAYLTRLDVSLSVTATIVDSGYYVTIVIISSSDSSESSTLENYSKYIEGSFQSRTDHSSLPQLRSFASSNF